MIRVIDGFHVGDDGDWVAEMSCLHNQHIRHRPPFQNRPWINNDAERSGHVGSSIECPLCDRAEMPEGLSLLRTAGPWDQDRLPKGLRGSHRTAERVCGMLRVTEGEVAFQMETVPVVDVRFSAGSSQPIPPGMSHKVVIVGPVRLVVEFWGEPR